MYCIQCGKQNPTDANFCYHCGKTMEKELSSPIDSREIIQESTEAEPLICEEINKNDSIKMDNKKGMAIIGLIFSIIGLAISVLCCVYFGSMILGIACSVVGIVLCAMRLKNVGAESIAVTGLSIGIIGVIIGIVMLIFLVALFTTNTISASFFENFIEGFLY